MLKLSEKVNSVELFKMRYDALNEKTVTALRCQANKLRALQLVDVLISMYDAKEAKDSKASYASRKFNLHDGRKVAVTADK